MQQQVGGADGEGDLVPEAVGQAVGEGLGARLAPGAVVVADLLPHAAALHFKVAAAESRSGRQTRSRNMQLKSQHIKRRLAVPTQT